MCLIIAIVLLIAAWNLFLATSYAIAFFSLTIALLALFFMIRNIILVKKERGRVNAKECLSCASAMSKEE